MRIRKNDIVQIRSGRDKGSQGKVMELLDGRRRIRVEGVNVVKRHVKAGGDPKAPQGGIIELAAPIDISNVRLVCSHCNQPTKAKMREIEDGKRRRYCPKCNESFDKD